MNTPVKGVYITRTGLHDEIAKDLGFSHAEYKDSDQTGQDPRLI